MKSLIKFIFISIYLFLPLAVEAHQVSGEEVDRLKLQVNETRVQLSQVNSRRRVHCNEKGSPVGETRQEIRARREWLRKCKQSQDPKLVEARELVERLEEEVRQLEQSPGYRAFKRARQRHLAALNEEGATVERQNELWRALEVVRIQWTDRERWADVSNRSENARHRAYGEKFCGGSDYHDDSELKEAYKAYERVQSRCIKAGEEWVVASGAYSEALEDYNRAVHGICDSDSNRRIRRLPDLDSDPDSSGIRKMPNLNDGLRGRRRIDESRRSIRFLKSNAKGVQ